MYLAHDPLHGSLSCSYNGAKAIYKEKKVNNTLMDKTANQNPNYADDGYNCRIW